MDFETFGVTLIVLDVSTLPLAFVALQVYFPESSGYISLTIKKATPFLYFTSMMSLEASSFPSLVQIYLGKCYCSVPYCYMQNSLFKSRRI